MLLWIGIPTFVFPRLSCFYFDIFHVYCSSCLCFLLKISSSKFRKCSTSAEPCAGAYPYGHPGNGQWWSAPWCHLDVPWTMWLAPPSPPRPPDNGKEAWSHPQPGRAGMWRALMAPQRHPVHSSLQRRKWAIQLLDLFHLLAWNSLHVVIAVNCNSFLW